MIGLDECHDWQQKRLLRLRPSLLIFLHGARLGKRLRNFFLVSPKAEYDVTFQIARFRTSKMARVFIISIQAGSL